MARVAATQTGRLDDPVPVASFPFADTIDVSESTSGPGEPSPCLPTATSTWYVLRPDRAGTLVVDLGGSTPLDPVVRLYRRSEPAPLTFVGCASPVWNAQHSLSVNAGAGDTILAQVGTSESSEGRLVVRFGLSG